MATMTGVMPRVTGEIREIGHVVDRAERADDDRGVLAIAIPPVAGLAVTAMFGWLLIFSGALHVGYAWRGHGFAAVTRRDRPRCAVRGDRDLHARAPGGGPRVPYARDRRISGREGRR